MNDQIFSFFYSLAHQSVFFDRLAIFFGAVFPILVLFGVSIFLLSRSDIIKEKKINKDSFKKLMKDFLIIFGPALIAFFIATILKDLIQVNRSFVKSDAIMPLFSPSQKYSFPSTHAAIFFALALTIYFLHKKTGYVFMFFALIIGLARITAGVHFPIDIFGGFILGIGIAYFAKNI